MKTLENYINEAFNIRKVKYRFPANLDMAVFFPTNFYELCKEYEKRHNSSSGIYLQDAESLGLNNYAVVTHIMPWHYIEGKRVENQKTGEKRFRTDFTLEDIQVRWGVEYKDFKDLDDLEIKFSQFHDDPDTLIIYFSWASRYHKPIFITKFSFNKLDDVKELLDAIDAIKGPKKDVLDAYKYYKEYNDLYNIKDKVILLFQQICDFFFHTHIAPPLE